MAVAREKMGVADTHCSRANHSCVCTEHAPSRETQVKETLNSPASGASVRAHIRVAQLEFFSAVQRAWGNANSPAGALWSRCGATEVNSWIIKCVFRPIMLGIKDTRRLMWIIERADKRDTSPSNWSKNTEGKRCNSLPSTKPRDETGFSFFFGNICAVWERIWEDFCTFGKENPISISNRKDQC